jgi:hypothetical protein
MTREVRTNPNLSARGVVVGGVIANARAVARFHSITEFAETAENAEENWICRIVTAA